MSLLSEDVYVENTYPFLINGSKKIWSFDFNKNYVFVNKVFSKNDKLRKIFEETLTKY